MGRSGLGGSMKNLLAGMALMRKRCVLSGLATQKTELTTEGVVVKVTMLLADRRETNFDHSCSEDMAGRVERRGLIEEEEGIKIEEGAA